MLQKYDQLKGTVQAKNLALLKAVGVTKVGGIFVQSGPIGHSGGKPDHFG